jgi:hypothetical protein
MVSSILEFLESFHTKEVFDSQQKFPSKKKEHYYGSVTEAG